MVRKKIASKRVAFQDGEVSTEPNLPYPIVYYPGHYGAFFAFSRNINSEICFCSCTIAAIQNYIGLRMNFDDSTNSHPLKNFILSIAHFPVKPVENLFKSNKDFGTAIIDQLRFKEGICHECNKQTPLLSYCNEMYGGVFERNYGWYINRQSFEYGVRPVSYRILETVCPDEVFSQIEIGKRQFLSRYNQYKESEVAVKRLPQSSEFQKYTRRMRNIIENEVRVKFGFKKVGEAWANETLLYQLVCEIFPNKKIYRHYRPDFLNFLELDVFIPHLDIGIEYQGIQHFKPVEHWGGEESLRKGKKRDMEKKKLCNQNNINLIYFYYYEQLSMELVAEKILGNEN